MPESYCVNNRQNSSKRKRLCKGLVAPYSRPTVGIVTPYSRPTVGIVAYRIARLTGKLKHELKKKLQESVDQHTPNYWQPVFISI